MRNASFFNKHKDHIKTGLGLILLSATLYILHIKIFNDFHHVAVFFLEDLAFIPIEVLVVSLIIEKVLEKKEKKEKLEKLNMLIGIFFTEIGLDMTRLLVKADSNIENIRTEHMVNNEWNHDNFVKCMNSTQSHKFNLDINKIDLNELKQMILEKRTFFINLISNPALLEHETFTELLMAIVHLKEELILRGDITNYDKETLKHLEDDVIKIYRYISYEWIIYMEYLKDNYPSLFVSASMKNPYNQKTA